MGSAAEGTGAAVGPAGGSAPRTCKDWAEAVRRKGLAGLKEEYMKIRTDNSVRELDMEAFKVAPAKLKRHATVTVWDHSRVTLRLPEDKAAKRDFIHANYVRGPYTHKDFILTQGPMPDSCGDFWGMVVQEKVALIVMLCRCEEEGKDGTKKSKSEQYWSTEAGGSMAWEERHISVKTEAMADVEDSELDGLQVRQTQLHLSRSSAPLTKRPVTHLQVRNWPDNDVPPSALGVFRFIRHLEERETELRALGHMGPFSPILIHCSAGVGRSGTLSALVRARHILLRSDGAPLDLFRLVLEQRKQRHMAVQTEAQYIWIHKALLILLASLGHIPADMAALDPADPVPGLPSPAAAPAPASAPEAPPDQAGSPAPPNGGADAPEQAPDAPDQEPDAAPSPNPAASPPPNPVPPPANPTVPSPALSAIPASALPLPAAKPKAQKPKLKRGSKREPRIKAIITRTQVNVSVAPSKLGAKLKQKLVNKKKTDQ